MLTSMSITVVCMTAHHFIENMVFAIELDGGSTAISKKLLFIFLCVDGAPSGDGVM